MTHTEKNSAGLLLRESTNFLSSKKALIIGTLASVVAVPSYIYGVHTGSYPKQPESTPSSLQTFRIRQHDYAIKPIESKTDLGRKLMELRNKAIASGIPLLTQEEVLLEKKKRRGELG